LWLRVTRDNAETVIFVDPLHKRIGFDEEYYSKDLDLQTKPILAFSCISRDTEVDLDGNDTNHSKYTLEEDAEKQAEVKSDNALNI